MSNYLIIPMFVHIAMTAFLYVLLTLVRAPTIWNIGANQDGTNPFKYVEQRISANLSNQFEWPLFFYVACFFLISQEHFYSVAPLLFLFLS